MINNGMFIMSSQELSRLKVLERLINKELTQVNAGKLLGLTDRQIRKLSSDYKKRNRSRP